MTTPSPTPWSARGRVVIEPIGPVTHWYIRDKSGEVIARVFSGQADAELVAAAPWMYEALRDVRPLLGYMHPAILAKIDAALAKVEGDDNE